ncbi:urea ABC transporter permease subunit UrtC [Salicibibacter halophilus]|uniref:Urea ABC transporter permease subunit UrtC n=1 Tax=Salicibibacter halophilus TaxID=2502791 RepID=A0A514LK82_9BACI|nr:urea ABC transporter permease subunit UrtC [Salicibibacter halophilus]QDI92259.1 urea ABC transporter permease subunit UrtC [Salicibibacter halophilus]
MNTQIIQYFTSRKWLFMILFAILVVLPSILTDFHINLLGQFIAFAILVIGLDLLWGYTGVLSLGHGIFFGVGAYIMAMYLTMASEDSIIPEFMIWNGITELPVLWVMFQHPAAAIAGAIVVPMLIAGVIGFFTFRNRIKDVYFTILTQALVIATVTLIVSRQDITGGSDGLTGFTNFFGHSLQTPSTQLFLYYVSLANLAIVFILCYKLTKSRFGKALIAIRDQENRLRFSGYNTAIYKTFIFTLSAGIAGLAGMLFVTQLGIITPEEIGIVPSIEMALWVAIGGRGTLVGPVIGAILVNAAKAGFSEMYPEMWPYFLGAVFVIVVLFFPKGLMGIVDHFKKRGEKDVSGNSIPQTGSHS